MGELRRAKYNAPELAQQDEQSNEQNTEQESLSRKEIKELLSNEAEKKGLDPAAVLSFLEMDATDLDVTPIEKSATVALFAMFVFMNVIRSTHPEYLGGLDANMPDLMLAISNVLHEISQLGPGEGANKISQHLPYYIWELSLLSGAGSITQLLQTKRHREAHQRMKTGVEAGELNYDMNQGHLATFIGHDIGLVQSLERALPPGDLMVYGDDSLGMRVWSDLREIGAKGPMYEAFDRGDLQKAGAITIYTMRDSHQFLPDNTDATVDFDEIFSLIETIDDYESDKGIRPIPMIVVGNGDMTETYVTGSREGTDEVTIKLEDRIARYNAFRTRGGANRENRQEVQLLDPTDLVFQHIQQIVGEQKFVFHSSEDGFERYYPIFQRELESRGLSDQLAGAGEDAYVVRYDLDDVSVTHTLADIPPEKEIVVISDAAHYSAVIRRGVPENQVIVVSDLVVKAVKNMRNSELSTEKVLPRLGLSEDDTHISSGRVGLRGLI